MLGIKFLTFFLRLLYLATFCLNFCLLPVSADHCVAQRIGIYRENGILSGMGGIAFGVRGWTRYDK